MAQVSGTPLTSGTFTPTFIVTDSAGNTSNPVELDITINAGNLPLAVTPMPLTTGHVGTAYSFQLGAGGGTLPYTWTLSSGSLTGSGITLSSGGLLSGATPVAGTYPNLVFQVTDAQSNTALSASLTLTVSASALPLAVKTTGLAPATTGIPYSFQLNAEGGTAPYTWTLNSGSLTGSGLTLASGGVISGANPVPGGFGPLVFKVTDAATATALSPAMTLNVNVPSPTMFPLPLAIELLINNVWTDVTEFVYQRDDIHITGGRTDRSGQVNPAQCTLTFNNRDGRFSPNFVNGAYYPDLQRNTQIRISLVAATSSSGNTYTGYRFWGEVAEWPPVSDISGNDVYVSITANGPLRRAAQGGGEGSALTRYYASLTGDFAPVVYWPCEEDPDSQQIGSGLQGGVGMVVTQGSPVWKSVSNFNGSAPIGVLNRSTWDGVTPANAGARQGNDVFDAPGTYQWTAPVSSVQVNCWGAGGGGSNGFFSNRGGGGGGQFATNPTLGVTIGQTYTLTVGNGGSGGAGSYTLGLGGQPGSSSTFTGDSASVVATGGKGGGATGGAGGTGGTGTTRHSGGTGGVQTGSPPSSWGGGGGAGSGGTAAAGNNGGNTSTNAPGAAAVAVTGGGGGGSGGTGGFGSPPAVPGFNGKSPGGGGGAAGFNSAINYGKTGGGGNNGQVQLLYSPTGLAPPANILRFIMFVPEHGGNPNGVLIRAFTGGTVDRLDVQYRAGGNIRLFGYDASAVQLFDSGNLNVNADGRTLMVSAELTAHGTGVNWSLSAIAPGSPGVGNQVVTGTLGSSVMGGVTEVLAGPNQDITTTAIGHISVQYAFQPLWVVSQALDGHLFEGGAERFTRLANEQAMGQIAEYAETTDHWGFEDGTTQSWAAANGTLSNSGSLFFSTSGVSVNIPSGPFVATAVPQLWPSEGFKSLLLTANGSGSPSATSLAGASGQPVQPGDVASVAVDLYSPTGVNHAYVGLKWYNSSGVQLSGAAGETDCADTVIPAGQPVTLRLAGADAVAPFNATDPTQSAQFLAVTYGDHHTDTSGTQLYADHVRLSPHMGAQTRKAYREFLEEIEDLDQGILKEAKEFWGMKMRTRIRLLNQNPSVNLDYGQGMLSPPLTPVLDTQHVRNNVLVHRHKGSTVEVTLNDGQMSIREPPAGVGRFKKTLKTVANSDEQLAAIASWLLYVGTFPDERYPTITVNLARASLAGNALAPLMSAVAGVEVGDMVQLGDPLPFWFPSPTSQQMVIGYDETINARGWTITWNCITYTPFIQITTSLRRW